MEVALLCWSAHFKKILIILLGSGQDPGWWLAELGRLSGPENSKPMSVTGTRLGRVSTLLVQRVVRAKNHF